MGFYNEAGKGASESSLTGAMIALRSIWSVGT